MKHRLVPTLPVPNPTRSYWHTTHPNPLVSHRTTPTLPSTAPVIVIGSGISGAFCARELAAQGIKDILVLEARDICSGATGRVSPVFYHLPVSPIIITRCVSN